MNESKMELTNELLTEFQEIQRMVDEEDGVPYSTWTKFCTSYFTIFCC